MEGPARAAVDMVTHRAQQTELNDMTRLEAVLAPGYGAVDVAALTSGLFGHCRLTLNFHPDRIARDGESVARGLMNSGRYRPQSETGLSNGGRSAVYGGERTVWEHKLFGDVYDVNPDLVRPVYGALDLTRDRHGGSPRFGSSFIVLKPHCLQRTTFCVGDSHVGPRDIGTIEAPYAVVAGLFEWAATGDGLGRALSVEQLLARFDRPPPLAHVVARDLDNYVEAQVHGSVSLADDVSSVVLDPSFAGTDVEADLRASAAEYDFTIEWHGGSELPAQAVPSDFRGPQMPALAARVARADGVVDAAAIGRAAAAMPYSPPSIDGDAYDSPAQELKRLWHCVLRFGTEAKALGGGPSEYRIADPEP